MLKKILVIAIICASLLFIHAEKRVGGKWVQSTNDINSSIDDYTTNDDQQQDFIKNKYIDHKVIDDVSKPMEKSVSHEEIIDDNNIYGYGTS